MCVKGVPPVKPVVLALDLSPALPYHAEGMGDYPYDLLDHTADLAVAAHGSRPEIAFERCGYALFDHLMDLRTVSPIETFTVEVDAPADPTNLGETLIAWLNELLFRFESTGEIFCEFGVTLLPEGGVRSVHCGESFDPARHPRGAEIKAATYHGLELTQQGGLWRARVILDV